MAYAKVLGATSRKDGHLEGNGYLVSWCVGHLVELAPPNAYGEQYVKWSIHRFGNGIGFLACLFSLEQGHHVSITTLNVYSGDTTQKISPSFSVYDFSFSIGFPSAR